MNNSEFNSKEYWENRYKSGDDSGIGSKGIIAQYKAAIINNFVKENNVQTVCELGCGDIQFSLYNVPEFTGYDVSDFVIERNKKLYEHKFTTLMSDLTSYDLTMSLDVILHLIEDEVYYQYMKDLFRLSKKYVIIYSPDRDQIFSGIHNKFRKFTSDVPKEFKLIELINNPYKGEYTQADFYIFKKE
jgi:hypothetical protein